MNNSVHLDPGHYDLFEIAHIEELPAGERLFVDIGDQPIVVFNIDGEIYAVGDICTHDDGPLGDGDLEAYVLVCPRHGARFDTRSGKVISLPAVVDIPSYPVKVVDGVIFLCMPK